MTKNGKLRIRSYLIIFCFSEEIDSLRPTVTNYLPCSFHCFTQDLLSEYMNNAHGRQDEEGLNSAIDQMARKTRDLRRQLRKVSSEMIV